MDLNMPRMDGFESATEIMKLQREQSANRKLCVIVPLTAFVDQSSKQRCEQIGMEGFVNKPARKDQIKDLVLKACPHLA